MFEAKFNEILHKNEISPNPLALEFFLKNNYYIQTRCQSFMAQIYIEITFIKKFVQLFMLEVLAYKQTWKKTFRDNQDRREE